MSKVRVSGSVVDGVVWHVTFIFREDVARIFGVPSHLLPGYR